MTDRDSFIDEVTEEVRRDRLYGYLRRYGWIAVLVVVLIVAGAAYNEWRKAQEQVRAEALGDGILNALSEDDQGARAEEIAALSAEEPEAQAVLDMIAATQLAESGQPDAAAARLQAVAENGAIPEVYRRIAGFKTLLVQADTLSTDARRDGFESYAVPGNSLRLLAEEQLAMIELETGDREAALARLQSIIADAEAGPDLQQRALQVIVALGGAPGPDGSASAGN